MVKFYYYNQDWNEKLKSLKKINQTLVKFIVNTVIKKKHMMNMSKQGQIQTHNKVTTQPIEIVTKIILVFIWIPDFSFSICCTWTFIWDLSWFAHHDHASFNYFFSFSF